MALASCSCCYMIWIICCALLLEKETGPLTHIHSIGHLMKKQKNYIKEHLNRFAQKHNAHPSYLRPHHHKQQDTKKVAPMLDHRGGSTHTPSIIRRNDEWTFDKEEQLRIQELWNGKKIGRRSPPLTAYVEDSTVIPRSPDTTTYPLPLRTQSPSDLTRFEYPSVQYCSHIPATLPVNHPFHLNDVDGYQNVQNNSPFSPQQRMEYAKYTPVDADPFLPWIHDVFPNRIIRDSDGDDADVVLSTHIEFVAQNKRRCNTALPKFKDQLAHLEPQVALMQPIQIKRMTDNEAHELAPNLWAEKKNNGKNKNLTMSSSIDIDPRAQLSRYQLTSYEDADRDGQETRFICRFHTQQLVVVEGTTTGTTLQQVIMGETLSEYPYNYEYTNWRKSQFEMLPVGGKGSNGCFWNSVQHFRCPIPDHLQHLIGSGASVVEDVASLHVDIIPVRTRARKGGEEYFTEHMVGEDMMTKRTMTVPQFHPLKEYGSNHVLPEVSASGRWTNIPICKPSLPDRAPSSSSEKGVSSEGGEEKTAIATKTTEKDKGNQNENTPKKPHHTLIGCTWASAQFQTRGNAKTDISTSNRLLEWLTFHLHVVGMDHIYVYDNTGAHTNSIETDTTTGLAQVVDMFSSDRVTRIPWPFRVCNNNIPAHANTGERSSQYAAEASCRLRYGPHTEWLASFDTDEYLVPMGDEFATLPDWLNTVSRDTNILSFKSTKATINYDYTQPYWDGKKVNKGKQGCGVTEQEAACVVQRPDALFIETYNCESQPLPKPNWAQRAKKQIYRPDYVLNHYVHYSTVTKAMVVYHGDHNHNHVVGSSVHTRAVPQSKRQWSRSFGETEPSERFTNELTEAVMIHTKSTLPHETNEYLEKCHHTHWPLNEWDNCRVGFVRPLDYNSKDEKAGGDGDGDHTNIIKNYQAQGFNYTCYSNPRLETTFLPKLRDELAKVRAAKSKNQ
jgi:hypothetical protein